MEISNLIFKISSLILGASHHVGQSPINNKFKKLFIDIISGETRHGA